MEFKGQYLNYSEYKELGGSLDLMPFNLFEFKARKKLDEYTRGRLINLEQPDIEVKTCVYNLIRTFEVDESYLNSNTQERERYLESIILRDLNNYVVNGQLAIYRG